MTAKTAAALDQQMDRAADLAERAIEGTRRATGRALDKVESEVQEARDEAAFSLSRAVGKVEALAARTGRRYAPFEYVGAPDADRVIVVMGSGALTAEETAAWLREEGYDDLFVVNPPPADTPASAIAAQIALGRVYLPEARVYAKGVAAGFGVATGAACTGARKVGGSRRNVYSRTRRPVWDCSSINSSRNGSSMG